MAKSFKMRFANPPVGLQSLGRPEQVEAYDAKLTRDPEWAMSEGSRFFEGEGEVQKSLIKVTTRLRDLEIDCAVVGGMALFRYGFRRFTEDVDLLVTREGLKAIHEKLDGLGYVPLFEGSKNLRDAETGVKIEFLVTGGFPGDGKSKPVAFPAPRAVAVEHEGIPYVKLETLVELKIASGMSGGDRMKDLSDVIELMKILGLPLEYGNALDPYVHEKYAQLWNDANPRSRRFVTLWRNKWLTSEVQSLQEMIDGLESAADHLRAMLADGVTLDAKGGSSDDYAYLVTSDPVIAKKYDMHDEREFLENDTEDEDREN